MYSNHDKLPVGEAHRGQVSHDVLLATSIGLRVNLPKFTQIKFSLSYFYQPEMPVSKGLIHPIIQAKSALLGNMGTPVHLVIHIKATKRK